MKLVDSFGAIMGTVPLKAVPTSLPRVCRMLTLFPNSHCPTKRISAVENPEFRSLLGANKALQSTEPETERNSSPQRLLYMPATCSTSGSGSGVVETTEIRTFSEH